MEIGIFDDNGQVGENIQIENESLNIAADCFNAVGLMVMVIEN